MSKTTSPVFSRMGTAVGESATLRQAARVAELRKNGRQIFNFTVGEPDFDAPEEICQAAHAAIDDGHTHYTPSAGTLELRQELAEYYSDWHGLPWSANQTIVSAGAKQVLYNALASIIEPNDEVILISPYWTSYPAYVKLLGGTVRVIQTRAADGFKANGDMLRAKLGPKTKALLFNSPVNPTGVVYGRDDLADLFEPLRDSDVRVISDEIYERLIYEGQHVTPLAVYPELRDRFMVATGASKSFAMTGWRIGFGLGPEAWIQAMVRIQSHTTGNPNSVAQRATSAALKLSPARIEAMRSRFQARRDLSVDILKQLPGLVFPQPKGSFYIFADVSAFYGEWRSGKQINGSQQLSEHLLENHNVAVVPGEAFDEDAGLRISYSVSRTELKAGLERFVQALSERS